DNEVGGTLTVIGSLVRGNTSDDAGGIRNDGTLTLTRSAISGNSAGGAGGIDSFGTLIVADSMISGNTAVNPGGIDLVGPAPLPVSAVRGKGAAGSLAFIEAGGIDVNGGGNLTMTTSTTSGIAEAAVAPDGAGRHAVPESKVLRPAPQVNGALGKAEVSD